MKKQNGKSSGKKEDFVNSSYQLAVHTEEAENKEANDSFLSYHTQVSHGNNFDLEMMRSLKRISSERPDMEKVLSLTSETFTSVMNAPKKKTSLINDIFSIFRETVVDPTKQKFQSMKGSTPVKPKVVLPQVNTRDFIPYVVSIQKDFGIYQSNMQNRFGKAQSRDKIDLNERMNICHQRVSSHLFEEKFVFSLEEFAKDPRKMDSLQEELTEQLDEVEINLFLQIRARFNQFVEVILGLNQMEEEIERCITNIATLRQYNSNINDYLCSKSTAIIREQRKLLNVQKTITTLEVIKLVKKTMPTLQDLIAKGKYEHAALLINNSETTYSNSLRSLVSLRKYESAFGEMRANLKKIMVKDFQERFLEYFAAPFTYGKGRETLNETTVMEESFLNVSIVNEIDEDPQAPVLNEEGKASSLPWTLNEYPIDPEREARIAKLVIVNVKLKDFSFGAFKLKLIETLRQFHEGFTKDLIDLVVDRDPRANGEDRRAQKNLFDVMQQINFELFIKLMMFYFQVFRRVIERQCSLTNQILGQLFSLYDNKLEEERLSDFDKTTHNYLMDLTEDLLSSVILPFRFFTERFADFMNKKRLDDMSIVNFQKLVSFFTSVTSFAENDLIAFMSFRNASKVRNKEAFMRLISKVQSSSEKVQANTITALKLEIERSFVNSYHRTKLANLKSSLELEIWQPTDIPYSYLAIFKFLSQKGNESQGQYENLDKTEELLCSSRGSSKIVEELKDSEESKDLGGEEEPKMEISDELKAELDEEAKTEIVAEQKQELKVKLPVPEEITILKNEIYINKSRYKLTNSFLLLIKAIYDYMHIAENFPTVSADATNRIIEIVRFYNSYTCQLILSAGAIHFQQIKTITAKILAMSSLGITLLSKQLESVQARLQAKLVGVNKDWIEKEFVKIGQDLTNHDTEIHSKIIQILHERLVHNSKTMRNLDWGNQHEKINIPTRSTAQILANTRQMFLTLEDLLNTDILTRLFTTVLRGIEESYVAIFETLPIDTKIAGQRIKDELEYFLNSFREIPIYREIDIKDLEVRVLSVIQEKCNPAIERAEGN